MSSACNLEEDVDGAPEDVLAPRERRHSAAQILARGIRRLIMKPNRDEPAPGQFLGIGGRGGPAGPGAVYTGLAVVANVPP